MSLHCSWTVSLDNLIFDTKLEKPCSVLADNSSKPHKRVLYAKKLQLSEIFQSAFSLAAMHYNLTYTLKST